MTAVEDFITSIADCTRKSIPRHLYMQIDDVKEIACSRGLPEDDIHALIKTIVSRKLPNRCFLAVLRCLIPKTIVSKDSVKLMLAWVTSNFLHASNATIMPVLQWISYLLEFEVADKQAVDDFYIVFLFLLKKKKLIPLACRLIHFLTKPDDVTRWSVSHVLATAKLTEGLKQPALAVLNLFKSFKPECVPENIPPVSVSVVFRQHPDIVQLYFGRAQRRTEALQSPRGRHLDWRTLPSTNKKRKYGQELIPPVDYINIGPSMYKDKSAHSVLKFTSFPQMCGHQPSLAIPSSVMSLLANHAGRHIIAFGDVQLQSRFSYLLFNKLYDALILKEPFPREEVEGCLSCVYKLEEYMQQGVPVASKILSEYIIISDGAEFQDIIFRLLEWVTTTSYTDLYNCVLHHIRNSFLSMDAVQRCAVIRMFRRLVTNMYVSIVYRKCQTFEKPFLTCHQEWNTAVTLEKVIFFVLKELVVLGFSQFVDDYLFLEEVVTFCETVLYLQEDDISIPLHIVIPPAVVSRCVFGRYYFLISRVHTLLKRYKTLLKKISKDDSEKWQNERHALQRSCREFNSALFGQVEFSGTVTDAVAGCKMYDDLGKLFRVNRHLAFSPHISLACRDDTLAARSREKHFSLAPVRNNFEDVSEIESDDE